VYGVKRLQPQRRMTIGLYTTLCVDPVEVMTFSFAFVRCHRCSISEVALNVLRPRSSRKPNRLYVGLSPLFSTCYASENSFIFLYARDAMLTR